MVFVSKMLDVQTFASLDTYFTHDYVCICTPKNHFIVYEMKQHSETNWTKAQSKWTTKWKLKNTPKKNNRFVKEREKRKQLRSHTSKSNRQQQQQQRTLKSKQHIFTIVFLFAQGVRYWKRRLQPYTHNTQYSHIFANCIKWMRCKCGEKKSIKCYTLHTFLAYFYIYMLFKWREKKTHIKLRTKRS